MNNDPNVRSEKWKKAPGAAEYFRECLLVPVYMSLCVDSLPVLNFTVDCPL